MVSREWQKILYQQVISHNQYDVRATKRPWATLQDFWFQFLTFSLVISLV